MRLSPFRRWGTYLLFCSHRDEVGYLRFVEQQYRLPTFCAVIQELGREGVLPFSGFFASNKPFNAPFAGLFSQYLVTGILVSSVPPGDAYLFMLNCTYISFYYSGKHPFSECQSLYSIHLPPLDHQHARLRRTAPSTFLPHEARLQIQLEPALPRILPHHRLLLPLKRLPRFRANDPARGRLQALPAYSILGTFHPRQI